MNLVSISGIDIRQDAEGRYSLNDLHRAAGGEGRHRPSYWLANQQTKELIAELRGQDVLEMGPAGMTGGPTGFPAGPVAVVNDGVNNGTYAVKEMIWSYAMWISPSFHLKVLRACDLMMTDAWTPAPPAAGCTDPQVERLTLLRDRNLLPAECILAAAMRLAGLDDGAPAKQVSPSPDVPPAAPVRKKQLQSHGPEYTSFSEIARLARMQSPNLSAALVKAGLGVWQEGEWPRLDYVRPTKLGEHYGKWLPSQNRTAWKPAVIEALKLS